jgi:RimJ/RimL family protein N-acetyltransferase
MSVFLQGKKVSLRVLREQDIDIWFKWFNNERVTDYMNKGVFPNTKQLQKEYFNKILISKNDIQLAIIVNAGNKLIGTVGIHKIDWVNRNADISIVIGDEKYWGKGLAKEVIALVVRHAFTKINLHKLTAGMIANNIGSRKCFESNGFVHEGIRREHFFHNGRYVDVYMLGLLRYDWEIRNRTKGCL